MKRFVMLLATCGLVVGAAMPVFAQSNPKVNVDVFFNGTNYDYSAIFTPTFDGKGWFLGDPSTGGARDLNIPGQCRIKMTGYLNPDPSISYGITAQNFTGVPMNFTFIFQTPITLAVGATTVDASVSGGITDTLSDGVSVTPLNTKLQTSEVLNGALVPTNMGVDVGNAFAAGAGGLSYAYGAYSLGPQAGPASPPWAHLRTTNAFKLSPDFDVASFTGFAEIVPEPASIMAFATGLITLTATRRRRARRN